MMFADRIGQTIRVPTGEYDDYGAPIYETSTVEIPAELRPPGSAEAVSMQQDLVHTRYRLFVGSSAALTATASITWHGPGHLSGRGRP